MKTFPKLSELMDHHRSLWIQYMQMESKVTNLDRWIFSTRYKYLVRKKVEIIEAEQELYSLADFVFPLSLKIELQEILNSETI
jgi:hypothetical protein